MKLEGTDSNWNESKRAGKGKMEFRASSSPRSGQNAKVKVLLNYVGYILRIYSVYYGSCKAE